MRFMSVITSTKEFRKWESVDMSVAALRTLPKMCNYKTLADTLIRERIVVGV